MKLIEVSISNFKSIKSFANYKLSSCQALIGENNAGKSNVLSAIDVFLSSGSGGVQVTDFNNSNDKIIIKCKFNIHSPRLKKIWKPYLINDELVLEKHIWNEFDTRLNKTTIKNEFHGYQAEPMQWYLSIKKIKEQHGDRPNWSNIVSENNLPAYFIENDRCNATIFSKALIKYFNENEIEYDEPDLSHTQALGLQSYAISCLPKFYLLKAITDYSEEIDKRSTNTTFRKLMADLSDRIIRNDPLYCEVEGALTKINNLLNLTEEVNQNATNTRLNTLSIIETKIKEILCKLMPSVENVKLKVITEDIKTIFSKGVELSVNDGVDTDVLLKGNGLQRCIVFSLLQTLILNEKNHLISNETDNTDETPIILAIEEPELYIHPQLGKLFYDVLKEFSLTDQVIYTTHSPKFVDVFDYQNISIVSKTREIGTTVINCNIDHFVGLTDRNIFKGLTQLNADVNELFFAKKVIIVEGPEDKIAITEVLKKQNLIINRTEELDITITVAGGKQSIPFFIRILKAFDLKFVVLHDLDIRPQMNENDIRTENTRNNNILTLAGIERIVNFPIKLEETLGLSNHLKDQYDALKYFQNHENINEQLESIINMIIRKLS